MIERSGWQSSADNYSMGTKSRKSVTLLKHTQVVSQILQGFSGAERSVINTFILFNSNE